MPGSPFRLKLHWQILIALGLAILLGQIAQATFSETILERAISTCSFIGDLFLRALKMIIVPLIASAIISAVSSLGQEKAFGRLGLKTLAYYVTTSLLAVTVGLVLVNLIQPGIIDGRPAQEVIEIPVEDNDIFEKKVGDRGAGDVLDVFKRMIPTNIFAAASDNGQMLGLIVFALIFGFFSTKISGPQAEIMGQFWQGVYDVMIKITDFIMLFAPIGVFGLVAKVAMQTDLEKFTSIFWFPVTVLLALAVHFLVTMPLILFFAARVNPLAHYRAMGEALLTAFSTASSSATLPVTMDCLTEKAGVSRRITSFTTPLGATVNMDGTALYECVAVIFLMQAFGLEIGFGAQFLTLVLALLTSIGVAGIPSASLVAIVVILTAVGMPADVQITSVALLMVFDRILDMCRTAVNVFGDSCGAVLIARSEGEETALNNQAPISSNN